jgi:periplasmic copper chaperone A
MRTRALLRAAAALGAAIIAAVASAPGTASAHVTVSSPAAIQGGYAKVTFRVPNEKGDASTTKLEVTVPADRPIASVSVKPVAGWTAATEKTTLATPIKTGDGEITASVTRITWTAAADAAIQPGQFQEFDLSLGPLPETDQIVFKALQTYSDGDVVRWIEEPSGDAEPQHPAPVLKLAKPAQGSHIHGAAAGAETAAVVAGADAGPDTLARTSAIGGLVIAVAGLILALLAYRKAATHTGT